MPQNLSVPQLDKKLLALKFIIYIISLITYFLFGIKNNQEILVYTLFILLLSYNLVISKFLNIEIPKYINYYLMIIDTILISAIVYNAGNIGFSFQFLFFLPIIGYSLRLGFKGGIISALSSFGGLVFTLIFSSNKGLLILIYHIESWFIPGSVFITVAWFIGHLVEKELMLSKNNIELQSIANLDSQSGVYNNRYFRLVLNDMIAMAEKDKNNISLIMIGIDEFTSFSDTYGVKISNNALQQLGEIFKENIRGKDKVARISDDEFCIIMPGADSLEALEVAEKIRCNVKNFNFDINSGNLAQLTVSLGLATYPKDANSDENLIYRAEQTLYRAMHIRKDRVCLSSVNIEEVQNKIKNAGSALAENIPTLVAIIDAKDVNTCGHSERVTKTAIAIGKAMGIEGQEFDNLKYGALLHDIGKVGVEEYVLDKPGSLSETELDTIRNHPAFGANFISSIDYLKQVTPIVYSHHERWDGSGYPDGIKGEDIPLGARIIGVADSFDAMISERPYKKPLTKEEAVLEIKKCSGTQFDPEVVNIFLELVNK